MTGINPILPTWFTTLRPAYVGRKLHFKEIAAIPGL